MKKYLYVLPIVIFSLVGCNDSFLDLYPRHELTPETFFKSELDLQVYSNGFYDYYGINTWDDLCDNYARYTFNTTAGKLLGGVLTPKNVGGWSWSEISDVNYYLKNASNAEGDEKQLNHWIGFGRLTRAMLYYDKVMQYGDVPWYDVPLKETDTELLYKGRDSRDLVVNHIMEDLDFAADNMLPNISDRTVVSQAAAIALQARIALHEGTFRKYHHLSDAEKYLTIAHDASKRLIDNAEAFKLALHKDYGEMFNSKELKGNSEAILYREHVLGMTELALVKVLNLEFAASRDFVNSYLMSDGSRFSERTDIDIDKATIDEQFENRDKRLKASVLYPGWVDVKVHRPFVLNLDFGGYAQTKFYPSTSEQCYYYTTESDIAQIRFAEVLLIYAESCAELGTITDDDLDKSINLLRQRAGIFKKLTVAEANASPDPLLLAKYPNLDGNPDAGIITEIRRERRVELFAEGFRFQDLMRWHAGEQVANAGIGIYVPGLGPMDVTGDGKYDIAILKNLDDLSPISGLSPQEQKDITKITLDGASYYLENGDHGLVRFTADRDNPRKWDDKYYFLPLPQTEILLNENLKQTQGW